MNVGEIIRNNRVLQKVTQANLCEGICSITHLSKIENGSYTGADETIELLAERLNINIGVEKRKVALLREQLTQLLQAIIDLRDDEARQTFGLLEMNEDFLHISSLATTYLLTKLRYLLYSEQIELANATFDHIQRAQMEHDDFYHHCLGVYYLYHHNFAMAVHHLAQVSSSYSQVDYYYHLSLGYYYGECPILSFHYLQLAVEEFRKVHNYYRLHECEILSMNLLTKEGENGLNLALVKGLKLIEVLKKMRASNDIIHRCLAIIGYCYFQKNDFETGAAYYKESLQYVNKYSSSYLSALYSYLTCKDETGELGEVLNDVFEGMSIAKQIRHQKYEHYFTVLMKKNQRTSDLYGYIENQVLPYCLQHKDRFAIRRFSKELFQHLSSSGRTEEALSIANIYIQH